MSDIPLSDTERPPEPSSGGVCVAPVDRLRKRWQFLAASNGLRAARGAVVVQMLTRPPDAPNPHHIGAGFTATRKIGNAVVRNRAKRRLREAARLLLPLHGRPGCDYVFVARAGTPGREWVRLLDDVKNALITLAAGRGDPPSAPRPSKGRSPASRSSGPRTSSDAPAPPPR